MCWVRGPSSRTAMLLLSGSLATQSHSTCVALRSLVRSSSSCTCATTSWRKERWCKYCACSPARTRKARDGGMPDVKDALGCRQIQPFG
jgi:hypothetical protein